MKWLTLRPLPHFSPEESLEFLNGTQYCEMLLQKISVCGRRPYNTNAREKEAKRRRAASRSKYLKSLGG